MTKNQLHFAFFMFAFFHHPKFLGEFSQPFGVFACSFWLFFCFSLPQFNNCFSGIRVFFGGFPQPMTFFHVGKTRGAKSFPFCHPGMWVLEGDEVVAVNGTNVEGKSLDEVGADLGGGFRYFLFSSLFGEDSHFDSYFSNGLAQPPTSDPIHKMSGLTRGPGEPTPNSTPPRVFIRVLVARLINGNQWVFISPC